MNKKNHEYRPFVSVIVPVYNDPEGVQLAISAVLNQTYPTDRYELIVVDNGSEDHTLRAIRLFPVTVLQERDIKSSYAARNKGLDFAKGHIIAFTDSDAVPMPDWIEKGVSSFASTKTALVGGRIQFVFSKKRRAAEYYDAISNLQNEDNIRTRGVAKTANLFVKREVFEKLGSFPADVKSGGDVYFTAKATMHGFVITYNPDAVVKHPTRTLYPLLRKAVRVGIGKFSNLKKGPAENISAKNHSGQSYFSHLNPIDLRARLLRSGHKLHFMKFVSVFAVSHLILAGIAFGMLFGFFASVMPKRRPESFTIRP